MNRIVILAALTLFLLFAATLNAAPAGIISGKVVETMNSGGYTYVCLEKSGQKTWVAIPATQKKITVGKKMSFNPGTEMVNFESKTLKRTFESIIFSDGIADPKAAKAAASADLDSGSKGKVVKSKEKIKVAKATAANAYTVAEIYKKAKSLDKKEVAVKGKVVKVSSGIMKRNWVHIQDGTGEQKIGTHNLVVTTKDLPAVDDIVTATGTISKDKDFGAGYKYDVIMEDATIKK